MQAGFQVPRSRRRRLHETAKKVPNFQVLHSDGIKNSFVRFLANAGPEPVVYIAAKLKLSSDAHDRFFLTDWATLSND